MQTILKSKMFIAAACVITSIAAVAVISVNVNHSGNALQIQLDLGNKYVSELDYENAIIAYEEALEIDPYCLEAYLGLSDAYLALGQEDKAIEIMEQAKSLLPDNVEIYVSLAELYESRGQISLALSVLEEGIQATDSDRLKAMLDEYRPGRVQPELADRDSRKESAEKSEESPAEPENTSISIGIRQDTAPVLVVSREDEEMVEIPLIVPVPGNNDSDSNSGSGGEGSSNISGGGNEDGSGISGNEGGEGSGIPNGGDEDDSSIPDTGDESGGNIPDAGDESGSNIPDTGDEGANNVPDGGNGDGCDTPAVGDGGDHTPDIVVPVPPRTGIAGNVYGIHGQGIEGVTVTVYSGQNEVIVTASTDTIGSYLQELLAGDYRVVLSKEGYADLSTSVSVLNDVLTSNSYIMLTEEESLQSASLKGIVISAVDSAAVEGATVALLNGFDNASYNDPDAIAGSPHTTTGANGGFSMENGVTAGYYTVVTSKDNYSTYHHNETVRPGENEYNISMSPLIRNQGVYRIVLTWGSNPRDLDSHITSAGNDNYHVYYANKKSGDGKAVLDIDVTNSYGPETITLEIGAGNSYIYSVHNYTNSGAVPESSAAWNLANSGANVKVYGDEGMIFDGNVPTNEQGITWEVFRIENGRLTVTNKICFDHPRDLPQIASTNENYDMTAESIPTENGREAVLQTAAENEVQTFRSPALAAENNGTEKADSGEIKIEETIPEEAEEEENAESEAGNEEETAGLEGVDTEEAEESAEPEKPEEIMEPEEPKESGEAAEPEESAEASKPEESERPFHTEEALKPEEEIHIEEILESAEMKEAEETKDLKETEELSGSGEQQEPEENMSGETIEEVNE